ncbi:MAG: putative glycolipid-binding domain-containing protein [Jhaorihella sp.]
MTGDGAGAMAHWRRLDRQGTDRCTLGRTDQGWMLTGQAVWREDGEVALTYAVRCNRHWHTLSADITGTHAGREIGLRILRTPEGWQMNDTSQPDVADCTDIDLSFTPATNLLALRRLALDGPAPQPVSAAWLPPDLARLRRLDQTYARVGDGRIDYASPGFSARLSVHDSGFVTQYPGLWEGWVDDG